MAKTYGGEPADHAGISRLLLAHELDPGLIYWACRDYNRACLWHGLWADKRDAETKLVPAKKTKQAMTTAKKYTTLRDVLRLPAAPEKPDANQERNNPKGKADQKAAELLSDPAKMSDYMNRLIAG